MVCVVKMYQLLRGGAPSRKQSIINTNIEIWNEQKNIEWIELFFILSVTDLSTREDMVKYTLRQNYYNMN